MQGKSKKDWNDMLDEYGDYSYEENNTECSHVDDGVNIDVVGTDDVVDRVDVTNYHASSNLELATLLDSPKTIPRTPYQSPPVVGKTDNVEENESLCQKYNKRVAERKSTFRACPDAVPTSKRSRCAGSRHIKGKNRDDRLKRCNSFVISDNGTCSRDNATSQSKNLNETMTGKMFYRIMKGLLYDVMNWHTNSNIVFISFNVAPDTSEVMTLTLKNAIATNTYRFISNDGGRYDDNGVSGSGITYANKVATKVQNHTKNGLWSVTDDLGGGYGKVSDNFLYPYSRFETPNQALVYFVLTNSIVSPIFVCLDDISNYDIRTQLFGRNKVHCGGGTCYACTKMGVFVYEASDRNCYYICREHVERVDDVAIKRAIVCNNPYILYDFKIKHHSSRTCLQAKFLKPDNGLQLPYQTRIVVNHGNVRGYGCAGGMDKKAVCSSLEDARQRCNCHIDGLPQRNVLSGLLFEGRNVKLDVSTLNRTDKSTLSLANVANRAQSTTEDDDSGCFGR